MNDWQVKSLFIVHMTVTDRCTLMHYTLGGRTKSGYSYGCSRSLADTQLLWSFDAVTVA